MGPTKYGGIKAHTKYDGISAYTKYERIRAGWHRTRQADSSVFIFMSTCPAL